MRIRRLFSSLLLFAAVTIFAAQVFAQSGHTLYGELNVDDTKVNGTQTDFIHDRAICGTPAAFAAKYRQRGSLSLYRPL